MSDSQNLADWLQQNLADWQAIHQVELEQSALLHLFRLFTRYRDLPIEYAAEKESLTLQILYATYQQTCLMAETHPLSYADWITDTSNIDADMQHAIERIIILARTLK